MEFKFRGLTEDGMWVYGKGLFTNDSGTYIVTGNLDIKIDEDYWEHSMGYPPGAEDFHITGITSVKPETVGLCSPAFDENKVQIFQHDIVEFTVFDMNDNDNQYTGIVVWTGYKFEIHKSIEEPYFGSDGPYDLDWVCGQDDAIRVINNIHEAKNDPET